MARRMLSRLSYLTVDDEDLLSEAFSKIEPETFAIAYKVVGTDDVFVTTAETREALDRQDIAYNLLAEEDGTRIAIFHTALSREELADFEDALKALALANRAIALACVGTNGESDLGFDLSEGAKSYTYFTAPAGHTFIFRIFGEREEARHFLDKLTIGDKRALEWVDALPLASAKELVSFH